MQRSITSTFALAAIALSACATGKTVTPNQSSADYVTSLEINETPATTAYDLVSRLRPNWLRKGGISSMAGGKISSQVILVYLDGNKIGELDALRNVTATGIQTMQWLDPARAETMLRGIGSEAIAGAIVLKTTTTQ